MPRKPLPAPPSLQDDLAIMKDAADRIVDQIDLAKLLELRTPDRVIVAAAVQISSARERGGQVPRRSPPRSHDG